MESNLGHSQIALTMDTGAHAMPEMTRDAATTPAVWYEIEQDMRARAQSNRSLEPADLIADRLYRTVSTSGGKTFGWRFRSPTPSGNP